MWIQLWALGKITRRRYSRNKNGQRLVEFCQEKGLAVTNSLFRHRASHRTTWVGHRRDEAQSKTSPSTTRSTSFSSQRTCNNGSRSPGPTPEPRRVLTIDSSWCTLTCLIDGRRNNRARRRRKCSTRVCWCWTTYARIIKTRFLLSSPPCNPMHRPSTRTTTSSSPSSHRRTPQPPIGATSISAAQQHKRSASNASRPLQLPNYGSTISRAWAQTPRLQRQAQKEKAADKTTRQPHPTSAEKTGQTDRSSSRAKEEQELRRRRKQQHHRQRHRGRRHHCRSFNKKLNNNGADPPEQQNATPLLGPLQPQQPKLQPRRRRFRTAEDCPDNIPAELLKYAPPSLHVCLTDIFNMAIENN